MDKETTTSIEKDLLERIIELFFALQLIHDSQKLVNQGRTYFLTCIYGQLRGILTDSTQKNRHKRDPLLLYLSQKLGVEFSFFINGLLLKQDEIIKELSENTVFQYVELGLSLTKTRPYHEEITIKDFLEVEVIVERGIRHKIKDIINNFSNNLGGAHYDPTVSEKVIGLKNIEWNGFSIAESYILEFSNIVSQLGIKIPKLISDFEIVFGFSLTEKAAEESYLFDVGLWKFRVSLKTVGKNLLITLSDLVGLVREISIKSKIEVNRKYLISISHILNTGFLSELNIFLNNEQLFSETHPPLLFFNNVSECPFVINGSINNKKQNFGFKYNWVQVLSKPLNNEQRLSISNFADRLPMNEVEAWNTVNISKLVK